MHLNFCRFLTVIFIFLTFSFSPLLRSASPQANTVSLSWEHFMDLWQKAKPDHFARASDFAYGPAFYQAQAQIRQEAYWLHFKATFQITSYSEHPVLVPFLARQLIPEKVTLNQQSTTWSQSAEAHQVLLPGPGRHQVSAQFSLKLNNKVWPRALSLPLIPMAQSKIEIQVPDEAVEAIVDPGVLLKDSTPSSGPGSVLRALVGASDRVHIKWLKKSQDEANIPLKLGGETHSYVSLEETGAQLQSQVAFRILQGKTNQFKLKIPKSLDILSVQAVDGAEMLSQWFSEEKGQDKIIHLYASYQQSEVFRVRVQLEQSLTQSTYDFLVPDIIPLGVERLESYVAVGSQNNVELQEAQSKQVEKLDVRFAGPEIQQFAQNQALYYYKVTPEQSQLKFLVKSHEEIPLSTTRIDQVGARTVLTESGTVMTKVRYLVKNNQAQFLKLKLPDNSQVLSIFLKGREVQPSYLEKSQELLIPLIKSSAKAFPIELAFTSQVAGLQYFGTRSLELPKTELAINELHWRLYTPDDFQMIRFGGNIKEKKPNFGLKDFLYRLLASKWTPKAYAGGGSYRFNEAQGLKSRFKYPAKSGANQSKSLLSNKQVQVQIPLAGDYYQFSSYLIKGSTPQIQLTYLHGYFQKSFSFLIGLTGFLLIFGLLAFLLERQSLPQAFKNKKTLSLIALFIFSLSITSWFFSFGIIDALASSVSLALLSFCLWQNRQVAKRWKQNTQGLAVYLTEIALGTLLLIAAMLFIMGGNGLLLVLAVLSILGHGFLNLVGHYWKKIKAKQAASALVLLIAGSFLWSPGLAQAKAPVAGFPHSETSRLRMDWEIIHELLRSIEEKKQAAQRELSPAYSFGNSQISGQISEDQVELTLSIPLQVLSKKPSQVHLLTGPIAIESAQLDGKPLGLVSQKGKTFFEIASQEKGLKILKLKVLLAIEEKGGVSRFNLKAPFLNGATVDLSYGQGVQSITIPNAAYQEKGPFKLKAVLGKGNQLIGEMASFKRKNESSNKIQKGVKKSYAQTYTLATLEESVITFYSSIRYEIRNDEVSEFLIRLPKQVRVHEIIGEDLQEWKKIQDQDGQSLYQAKVLYPVTRYYDLSVKYEQDFNKKDKSFDLPELKVEKVASNITHIGIESQENVAVQIKELKKAKIIDLQELPSLIASDASAPLIYALRHIESGFKASFSTQKHQRLELEALLADQVEYTHVLSPEGKVLAQARLYLRNSGKQFTRLRLPAGATLLSAFLDKQSIKPGKAEDGSILLPLKRQSSTAFVLDIVYEEKDQSLNSTLGTLKLNFPKLEMPVSMVHSKIYAPKDWVFSEPWGDFKKLNISGYARWFETEEKPTSLGGALDLAEDRPSQAPVLAEMEANPAINLRQAPLSQRAKDKVAGTLPLRIELPKQGQVLSATSLYLSTSPLNKEGPALSIGFFYGHQYLIGVFNFLQWVFFVGLGYCLLSIAQARLSKKILIISLSLLGFLLSPLSWQWLLGLLSLGLILHQLKKWRQSQSKN